MSLRTNYVKGEVLVADDINAITTEVNDLAISKQDELISGDNIKTINGKTILGKGDISLSIEAEQSYDSQSEKAQSGKAVAQAINNIPSNVYVGAYAPINENIDIWVDTSEDVSGSVIADSLKELIIEELAKRGQVKPEFANDISECTDTSKLYVLPDGEIYAYMYQLVDPNTNQISLSINSDGSQFVGDKGEDGYSVGYRLGAGNGLPDTGITDPTTAVTGFISVTKGDTLYFKNLNFVPETVNNDMVIVGYKSDFTRNNGVTSQSLKDMEYLFGTFAVDADKKLISLTNVDRHGGNIAYIRISAPGINSSTIITKNAEIEEPTKEYRWTSTGHKFVPADYESEILALQETAENHEGRIKVLEQYGGGSVSSVEVPAYIKAEADVIMNRLMEKQGNRVFNMVAMSDFHYSNYAAKYGGEEDDNRATLKSVAKATSYMLDRIHIDAVATLGDNTPFGAVTENEVEWGHKWHKEINEILSMTQRPGVVDFRTVGNHDRMGGTDANGTVTPIMPDGAIYQYIQGYNRQCDYLSAPVGYGYKDFEGYKLRVIVLNTAECEGKGRFSEPHHGYFIGNAQYNWLIKTLDMSNKEDASEWQILILSHHRADDAQVATDGNSWQQNAFILPNILNAYKTGGSYSGTIASEGISVSCNFAGKNQARLIGMIHGHHHNHKYFNLYLGPSDNSTQTSIMAIGTPTTSYGTTNPDNDGISYTSSALGTAEETTFSIYAIDLDAHKIYSINYGKGIDREIDY